MTKLEVTTSSVAMKGMKGDPKPLGVFQDVLDKLYGDSAVKSQDVGPICFTLKLEEDDPRFDSGDYVN